MPASWPSPNPCALQILRSQMFSLTPENSANDHLSFFIHRTIRQKFDCVIDDAQAMALRSFSFFFSLFVCRAVSDCELRSSWRRSWAVPFDFCRDCIRSALRWTAVKATIYRSQSEVVWVLRTLRKGSVLHRFGSKGVTSKDVTGTAILFAVTHLSDF